MAKKETVIDKILKSVYTIFINRLIKGIIFAKEGIKTRNGQEQNIFYTKRFVFFKDSDDSVYSLAVFGGK